MVGFGASEARPFRDVNPVCGTDAFAPQRDGEICEADCQCASGSCRILRDADPQMPKRCAGDQDACFADGVVCVDPGQCCGGLCVPADDGSFRCGVVVGEGEGEAGEGEGEGEAGACVEAGDRCTAAGDCCDGLQCAPDGAGASRCFFGIGG